MAAECMAPIISKYQSLFRQCIITFFRVYYYAGGNLIMNKTNASNLHLNDCFFFSVSNFFPELSLQGKDVFISDMSSFIINIS